MYTSVVLFVGVLDDIVCGVSLRCSLCIEWNLYRSYCKGQFLLRSMYEAGMGFDCAGNRGELNATGGGITFVSRRPLA